jgi:hypothetical protein
MDTSGNVIFDYEVTGSAASSIDTSTILDGNTDGWYTIIVRTISAQNTNYTSVKFNNDGGATYGRLGISATNATVASDAATGGTTAYLSPFGTDNNETSFSVATIYAKSGAVRLLNNITATGITGTTVDYLDTMGYVWNNSADNLTRMVFNSYVASGFGVGTRVIILKGNALAVGVSPGTTGAWKRVGTSVLGSAASSVTFSGLNGDTAVCYYLSKQEKANGGATGNVLISFNNDTGTNYGLQQLRTESTTVSAARSTTLTGFGSGSASSAGYITSSTHLIFAKQGFVRPAISSSMYSIDGTTVTVLYTFGQSYSVTNTNITEIDIATTTNNFDTGSQFDLYALYTA